MGKASREKAEAEYAAAAADIDARTAANPEAPEKAKKAKKKAE